MDLTKQYRHEPEITSIRQNFLRNKSIRGGAGCYQSLHFSSNLLNSSANSCPLTNLLASSRASQRLRILPWVTVRPLSMARLTQSKPVGGGRAPSYPSPPGTRAGPGRRHRHPGLVWSPYGVGEWRRLTANGHGAFGPR